MSSQGNNTPRTQGLQGAVGRNWRSAATRSSGQGSSGSSRMAGTLFYSVPTIDAEAEDLDGYQGGEELPLRGSYMQDYDSDDDGSDSSSHSPPMSLFLDGLPQSEVPPLTPAAIYLDVPPPLTSKSKAGGALEEQLLEPTAIPSGPVEWTSVSYKRNFRDPVFAVLYLFALAVYLIMGIVLLFTTSSSGLENKIYNVFSVIKSSAGMLTFVVLISAAVGTMWFIVLRTYARRVVWITVAAVPCFALVIFIWTMVSSFQGPRLEDGRRDPQDTGLTVLSFVPLSIGLLFIFVIYYHRNSVARTTEIIELACEILKDNPDMFFVSFGLMLVHVVFTAIWLVFFSRVFLIGHIESSSMARKWVQDSQFYPIAGFMIFMYMWTSAVISNVQRVTLANVVSKWYFHRNEPLAYHSSKITEPALINATTTLFGPVCLGALFIAIAQFITFLVERAAKQLKDQSSTPGWLSSWVAPALTWCCRIILGLVESFNNYTLIYVGITGESLFTASKSASMVFQRSKIRALLSDLLTKLVLYVYSALLALISGFAAYIFATHSLKSPYGYVVGILATVIPYYIARFFTHVMAITVDATFLCYAIDLDAGKRYCPKAHSAFSSG